MIATLTELRNPARLFRAADAGEVVVLTENGEPRYELRKATRTVDWDALEAEKETWLSEAEAEELSAAIARSDKVLTHDTVP